MTCYGKSKRIDMKLGDKIEYDGIQYRLVKTRTGRSSCEHCALRDNISACIWCDCDAVDCPPESFCINAIIEPRLAIIGKASHYRKVRGRS